LANFRYPLQPPVVSDSLADGGTDLTDYVVFQRKRILYEDNSKGYYGLNLPSNKVSTKKDPNRVYLAMPPQLQTAYRPGYRNVDLGVAGMALSILGMDVLKKGFELNKLTELVQETAGAIAPEFNAAALSGLANSASQALGLAGNIDSNAFAQLSGGKVFNPYTEQLFSNMAFRTHTFNFKMFSRSPAEAREVNRIIRYFKEGATPIIGGDDALSARFMEVPDKFDIKFIRLDPSSGSFTESADLHFKIFLSVCNGVTVNYAPDGQYNAFRSPDLGVDSSDGPVPGVQVPAVDLQLSFAETRFVSQADISKGY